MMAAMQKALGVLELLENIILYLPELDILIAQRVSHNWKAAINASPVIRTKIWLQSQKAAISPSHFCCDTGLLPIPAYDGSPVYTQTTLHNTITVPRNGLRNLRLSLGFLARVSPMPSHQNLSHGCSYSDGTNLSIHDVDTQPRKEFVAEGHCPSWYDMYISEPPVTTALLYARNSPPVKAMIHDKGGVTMGMVYDTLASVLSARESMPGIFNRKDTGRPLRAHLNWYETHHDDGSKCDGQREQVNSSGD
jgi:hypothetical protein